MWVRDKTNWGLSVPTAERHALTDMLTIGQVPSAERGGVEIANDTSSVVTAPPGGI
jgi:hypothetical protein